MPEEKREAKNAWVVTPDGRARFWATANELKLSKQEAHQALDFVESAYDFTGTLEEALAKIAQYAGLKAKAVEKVTEAAQGDALFDAVCKLPESPGVAWTKVQKGPGGPVWSITIRAGLPPELASEMLRIMLKEMGNVEKWLDINATFRPVYNSHEMAAPTASPPPPQQTTTKAQTKSATPPPPTGTGNGPPPPPPSPDSTPPAPGQQGNSNGNGFKIQTEFVKITAPKGKAVIEFWRPNRQYAEIRYHLGGEKFLKLAPGLVEAGWVASHFDAVGEEYTLALAITWKPSQPDGKYKDITAVAVRF